MNLADNLFTDGAAYERLMGRWSKVVGDRFLDWLSPPRDRRWIDIGCGTGAFTSELIRRCSPSEVVGIDPAADQLSFARGRPELTGVDFQVGDAQSLPYADDSFDVAVMALVIHFVPDPAKAVSEMARVVRPGGWASSYVWDYSIAGSPTAPIFAGLRAIGRPAPGPPSPHATSLAAVTQLWRAGGFEEVDTHVIRIPVTFGDFEEFWTSMTAPVGPAGKAIAQLAPDDVKRLRAALQEQPPPASDGSVRYEATANAVRGRVPT
jgi:SAM-dependent methyltransferase